MEPRIAATPTGFLRTSLEHLIISPFGRWSLLTAGALMVSAIVLGLLSARRPTRTTSTNRHPALRGATRQQLARSLSEQVAVPCSRPSELRALAIGKLGEGLVTAELEKGRWPTLRNLILDLDGRTVEIDHVIQVPDGIVVLEVKTYAGFVTGSEEDFYWTQHLSGQRNSFMNPIRQNLLHIRAVHRFIADPKVFVRGFVVSAGSARFRDELAHIPVPLRELRRAISAEVPTTDINPRVHEAWARLKAEASLSPSRRDDHIRFAKARKNTTAKA